MGAMILALRQRPPRSVGLYLCSQIFFCVSIWAGNWLWGIWSRWYATLYVAVTLPILWCIARLCWEALERRCYRARSLAISFLIAGLLGRLCYVGLPRPVTGFDWINLTLGVCLTWAGTLVGFAAPHIKRWDLALILGMLWLFQGLSSFGWTLHLWEPLNFIIDPVLGIVAFSILAWRLRLEKVFPLPKRIP